MKNMLLVICHLAFVLGLPGQQLIKDPKLSGTGGEIQGTILVTSSGRLTFTNNNTVSYANAQLRGSSSNNFIQFIDNGMVFYGAGNEVLRLQSGSGPIFPLGSAAAPSFSFLGDGNTGIYSGGADALDFTTGGVRRGGFNSSGTFSVAGNATFSGNNSIANNQLAHENGSLMTRILSDVRYGGVADLLGASGQWVFPVALSEMSAHTGTGGTVDTNRGRRRLITTTTVGSSALLSIESIPRNSSNQTSLSNHTGISVIMSNISNDGHTVGVFLGGLAANPTLVAMSPLGADGVSLQLRLNSGNHEVRWVTKNGGTEVAGSWASIGAVSVPIHVLVSVNGGTAQGRIRALDSTISTSWLWSGSVSGLPTVGGQHSGVGQVTTANPASSANITAIWSVSTFQGLALP